MPTGDLESQIKIISWIGNICIVSAMLAQVKGKLYLAFPASLLGSLLFFWYGFLCNDYSFILTNGLLFIPINVYGSIKWIIKHRKKELVVA
jgi:nicotinamide riboside transporter PnuC